MIGKVEIRVEFLDSYAFVRLLLALAGAGLKAVT